MERERRDASLQELLTFDRRLKPEGITRVSTGTRDFVFIVFDTSGYAATDDGALCVAYIKRCPRWRSR